MGNRYITGSDLSDYFADIESESQLIEKLSKANGRFSVVILRESETWVAVDPLRTYPLYYSKTGGEFCISDNSYCLAEQILKPELNQVATDSFLASGFTLNNQTILLDLYQAEAGEMLVFNDSVTRKFYCSYTLNKINKLSFDEAVTSLNIRLNEIFKNHLEALADRFIVIPLSGGYDSRLVAAMCSQYHPENVLCITYGREGNREVKPAGEAAKRLGLKWINIVYNEELIRDFVNDKYFSSYFEEASGLTSMFYLQDYFAVRHLKENSLIPENSVFMPGFSGDSLAGSFFRKSFLEKANVKEISGKIFENKFNLVELSRQVRNDITDLISEKINGSAPFLWKNYENWEIKEIHAKLIVNSARVFSFFGYDYVLPLFDKELIDFFTTVPFEFKLNKKLYDKTLSEIVFSGLGINLSDELNPTGISRSIQDLKEKMKRYIPSFLTDALIDKVSPIYYDEIVKPLIRDIGKDNLIKPRQANYYNAYLTQWYIMKIKQKYGIAAN